MEATLGEFLTWTNRETGPSVGPFSDYPLSDFWAYADYKYIAKLFEHKEAMFEVTISNHLFYLRFPPYINECQVVQVMQGTSYHFLCDLFLM